MEFHLFLYMFYTAVRILRALPVIDSTPLETDFSERNAFLNTTKLHRICFTKHFYENNNLYIKYERCASFKHHFGT